MSRTRSDLSNDTADARRIVGRFANSGQVIEVRVAGSRSPLRGKQPRPESDWDFVVITGNPVLVFPSLRQYGGFHGDVLVLTETQWNTAVSNNSAVAKSVAVWPTDEYGVLED
jgi:hypothetical protein